jgi:hypothetical protein
LFLYFVLPFGGVINRAAKAGIQMVNFEWESLDIEMRLKAAYLPTRMNRVIRGASNMVSHKRIKAYFTNDTSRLLLFSTKGL